MKFSPTDHLGAVQRSLTTTTRDGQPVRVLTVTRTYAAVPEEVWDALTTPDRIDRWLGPTTGEFKVGGRYAIEGNASGEILTCDRPTLLQVTWEYGGDTSWVDATLQPSGDSTDLTVEHTAAVPPELWDQFGPGAVGIGWELMLLGLAEHLAAPAAPRPDPEDPAVTTLLTEFMTGASAAWAGASIAAGTDSGQAHAAADRCLAFYTATEDPQT